MNAAITTGHAASFARSLYPQQYLENYASFACSVHARAVQLRNFTVVMNYTCCLTLSGKTHTDSLLVEL